jgi:hypothetical protein
MLDAKTTVGGKRVAGKRSEVWVAEEKVNGRECYENAACLVQYGTESSLLVQLASVTWSIGL